MENRQAMIQDLGAEPDGVLDVETARFGTLRVAPERVIDFPRGLVGLPAARRFTMLHEQDGESPFFWLQSLDDPTLAFVVCDPRVFFPDYSVPLPAEDQHQLGIDDPDDGTVCVILVIPGDPRRITANLRGPLVINAQRRIGVQLVLAGDEFPVRAHLFPAAAEGSPTCSS